MRGKLPRVIRRPKSRCAALDMNGKRCGHLSTHTEQYHGDHELYGYLVSDGQRPSWVLVKLCGKHKLDA